MIRWNSIHDEHPNLFVTITKKNVERTLRRPHDIIHFETSQSSKIK